MNVSIELSLLVTSGIFGADSRTIYVSPDIGDPWSKPTEISTFQTDIIK